MEPPASPLALVPLSFVLLWLGTFSSFCPCSECLGPMLEPKRPVNSVLPVLNCPEVEAPPPGLNSCDCPEVEAPPPDSNS